MGEGRSRDPKSLRKIWTDLKENQKDKHKNSVPMIMINLEHLIGFCILVQDDKHGNWCPLKCSILKNLVSLCEVVKDDNLYFDNIASSIICKPIFFTRKKSRIVTLSRMFLYMSISGLHTEAIISISVFVNYRRITLFMYIYIEINFSSADRLS